MWGVGSVEVCGDVEECGGVEVEVLASLCGYHLCHFRKRKKKTIEHKVGLPLEGPAVAADIYFPDAFHWSNVTKTISKPACPHQFSGLLITNL